MRILIVEDNSRVARFFGHLLNKEGFTTAIALSIQAAKEAMAGNRPDILILDRVLPDGDGSDLCREIKADPTLTAIYIILISGVKASEDEQISGLDSGADDYLIKPVSAELLLARVRSGVRSRRVQEELWLAHAALHKSEAHYRSTVDQAAVGITHVSPDGRFLHVNRYFCDLVGYSEEELLGMSFRDITFAQDLSANEEQARQLLDGNLASFALEKRYVHKSGSLVWVHLTASVLFAAGGAPQYFISVVRDISERKRAEDEIRQTSEAFRALAENTPDSVARFDRELRYAYVNGRAVERMGLPFDQIIGKRNRDLPIGEELYTLWDAAISEVFDKKEMLQIEFSSAFDNGTHHFETSLAPEFGPSGDVESVLTVTRDVTRRVEVEMENLRLATVVEQASEGVMITDPEGVILYVNPYVCQTTGYSWEELKGQPISILRSGIHTEEFYTEMHEKVFSGKAWRGTFVNRRKDGSLYHEAASIFPMIDRYGRITSFASVRRDVTEEKQRQHQREAIVAITGALRQPDTGSEILQATTEQMQALFQTHSVAVALGSGAGTKLQWQLPTGIFADLLPDQAAFLDGIGDFVFATGESYLNDNCTELAHAVDEADPVRNLCVAGVPLIVQRRVIGVLIIGRSLPLLAYDVNILAAVGDIVANALYRADLYAQSQEYSARLEKEVAERTRQLEEANAELHVLDDLKSRFITDVSHELRTPLASMKLYLDLLSKGKPEKQELYQHAIRQMVDRLTQLVEDILDLSRLETDTPMRQGFQLVDLNRIISQVVDVFRPRAEAVDLHLHFAPDPTLPRMIADSNQISRMVSNLLSNAVNYTPNGQVTIKTSISPNPGRLTLTVQDTGVGIDESDLPYVMDRFYRGKHGELGIPGTGLGLSIAKEIVDMHNGTLSITSSVGQGTTVTVSLPPVVKVQH